VQRFLLLLTLLITTAYAEVTWTDFSPKPVVVETLQVVTDDTVVKPVTFKTEAEVKTDNNLDKEKYRVYFEDETLVLMVLGGIEYWHMNCGELTSTGEYFMALAIKKHGIDEEEMHMDMSFQTGLFAATLYNSCDHFLGQVKSIGLGMMFVETPQIMDITPAETIIN
jgi:hypothetical protein